MEEVKGKSNITVGKLIQYLIWFILVVMVLVFATIAVKSNNKVDELRKENEALKSTVEQYKEYQQQATNVLNGN